MRAVWSWSFLWFIVTSFSFIDFVNFIGYAPYTMLAIIAIVSLAPWFAMNLKLIVAGNAHKSFLTPVTLTYATLGVSFLGDLIYPRVLEVGYLVGAIICGIGSYVVVQMVNPNESIRTTIFHRLSLWVIFVFITTPLHLMQYGGSEDFSTLLAALGILLVLLMTFGTLAQFETYNPEQ